MLIFSTLLFLFYIAVSEQQHRNANSKRYDLPIENTEGVLRRTQRNPEHHVWANRTKQTASQVKEMPCSDPRLIYDNLRYQANTWKHDIPISDETRIVHDPQFSQHHLAHVEKLPRKQVSQSHSPESSEKFTETTIIKVPVKNAEPNTGTVPEPVSDINTHIHMTIAYIPPEELDDLKSITESSSPSEESPDYVHSEVTNIKYQKQPIQGEHLESKTEPSLTFGKLPEYILQHRHNEAAPYNFGIPPVFFSEIDHQSNKPAQSLEDKEESTKPYISEKRAFSEKEGEIPDYFYNYNKINLSEKPIQVDNLQSESESSHIPQEFPEYILNHNYNEAMKIYFESSTVKSNDIDHQSNKPAQSIKNKEESTEPNISERRELSEKVHKLPDYFDNYNKTDKIELNKKPSRVDNFEFESKPSHTSEELPDYILKHNHDEAVTFYFESSTVKSSEKDKNKDQNKPRQSMKDKEESTEPYISEKNGFSKTDINLPRSDNLPDHLHKHSITHSPVQLDYTESETESNNKLEELPEYILKHNHNEAVTNYFENSTGKSNEINHQSKKPAQSIKNKEESTEPYISERKEFSEKGHKLPDYFDNYNKSNKIKLNQKPSQVDNFEFESEPSHTSEELPEYILKHNHNEVVSYYFDISTVKSSEKAKHRDKNKPTQSIEDKEESTEQYITERRAFSEKEDELPYYFDNYNKTNKIKHNKKPIDFVESEKESETKLLNSPKHNETVAYYFKSPTTKSFEIEKEIKKPAQSIGDKEESKVLHNYATRILSETDNDVPNYTYKHNKTTRIELQKLPVEVDYLESETKPNPSSSSEKIPEHNHQHEHEDAVTYIDIFPVESSEKLNPAYNIDYKELADHFILETDRITYIPNTKDKEESTKSVIETEDHTKSSVIPDINKTTHELKHKHSTSIAPDVCSLNKEELSEDLLSQDSRRSMPPENDLSIKPLITTKNQPKLLKKDSIHENPQKEISGKIKKDKQDTEDTNRFGSNAYSKVNILPSRNTYYPALKPDFQLQPTYHLMNPTKGAGISPLFHPKTLMMESTKVCYACSTLNDASCWFPDRTTTVKYCRAGYDLCVTKIYKKASTLGMIVIRDCNSACDVKTPGLDTHYDSCAICKDDLCNSLAIENSAFTISQTSVLPILVISAIIKCMY